MTGGVIGTVFGKRIGEAREVLRTVGAAHLIQLTQKVTSSLRSEEEFGQRIGEAREVLRTVGAAHLIQLTQKVTSSPEEFGQRDEVLQQLTQKVTSSPEEFGQRDEVLQQLTQKVTSSPEEFGKVVVVGSSGISSFSSVDTTIGKDSGITGMSLCFVISLVGNHVL